MEIEDESFGEILAKEVKKRRKWMFEWIESRKRCESWKNGSFQEVNVRRIFLKEFYKVCKGFYYGIMYRRGRTTSEINIY